MKSIADTNNIKCPEPSCEHLITEWHLHSQEPHWADGKCVLHEDKICEECIPTDVIEKYQDEIYKMNRRWI